MNKSNNEPDADKYAGPDEVKKAIDDLTNTDYKKLMIIANSYWRSRNLQARLCEAKDLLQEALLSTLRSDSPKRWRRGISIIKHLDQAMRNISGHWARKGLAETEGMKKLNEQEGEDDAGDTQVAAKETLEIIKDLFIDDEIALQVLECRSKGMVESEVRQVLGISHTEYETTCKRIRRKLLNFKNQGVPNAK